MSTKRVMVQVRLSEELVRHIDHIAVEWGLYRNETMERLIEMALPLAWEGIGTERVQVIKALSPSMTLGEKLGFQKGRHR